MSDGGEDAWGCTCQFYLGFTFNEGLNCSRGNFDPACVTGVDACSRPNLGLDGLIYTNTVFGLNLVLCIITLVRAVTVIRRKFNWTQKSITVGVISMFLFSVALGAFSMNALVFLIPTAIQDGQWYQDEMVAPAIFPAFVVFATTGLATVCAAWLQISYRAQKLSSKRSQILRKRDKVALMFVGTSMWVWFIIGKVASNGSFIFIVFLVYLIGLVVFFTIASGRLNRAASSAGRARGRLENLQNTSFRFRVVILLSILFAVPLALFDGMGMTDNVGISFITLTLYLGCYTGWNIGIFSLTSFVFFATDPRSDRFSTSSFKSSAAMESNGATTPGSSRGTDRKRLSTHLRAEKKTDLAFSKSMELPSTPTSLAVPAGKKRIYHRQIESSSMDARTIKSASTQPQTTSI